MTDSESDSSVPVAFRRKMMQMVHSMPNKTVLRISELAIALGTDESTLLRELELHPDVLRVDRDKSSVEVVNASHATVLGLSSSRAMLGSSFSRSSGAGGAWLLGGGAAGGGGGSMAGPPHNSSALTSGVGSLVGGGLVGPIGGPPHNLGMTVRGLIADDGLTNVKKPKHRRPLGKVAPGGDGTGGAGRVGYVCVADEFLLDELSRYYEAQGFLTYCDCDVLHVRLADSASPIATLDNHPATSTPVVPSSPAPTRGAPTSYGATAVSSSSSSQKPGGKQPRGATSSSTTTNNNNTSSGGGFDLFIFQYGAVVWWGTDQKYFRIVETDFISPSSRITKFIVNRYKSMVIDAIYPVWCTYSLTEEITDDAFKERLLFDHFLIPQNAQSKAESMTSMLCASHALAQSAKIDYLEIKIHDLTQSCKPLPRELKEHGRVTISERRLLQLRGEVLSYRLMLKSGSDLLDEPELFWQNAYLKPIFQATKDCFEITERVRALDTKLDAGNEILGMIAEQFNQRHGARLEWIVIWLVLVEVIIGVLELLLDVKPWLN